MNAVEKLEDPEREWNVQLLRSITRFYQFCSKEAISYFGGNGVEFSISMFVKPPPLQWYFKSKFNPVQNQSLKILVTLLQ